MAEYLSDESGRNMTKKQITAVILGISLPVIAYFVSEDIRCYRYLQDPGEINHRQVSSIEMTEKERMKDFEALWKVVSEGIPAVVKYPDEFGYDILQEKEKYQSAVENAASDIEFFCVMQSVLNDVPCAHTGFFFPDYSLITDYTCMGSEIVGSDPYLRDTTDRWNAEMKHYYRESRAVVFDYADGQYCYSLSDSEAKLTGINYTLKSVNGISADEFALKYLSSSSLGYDEEYGKMYRRSLIFNDRNGEKLTLELADESGAVTTEEVYCDLCDEYMFVNQPYLHGVYEKPEGVYDIRWLDEEKKIVYLRIDDLDNEKGSELSGKIKKYCSDDDVSVILDLRNNGGGTLEYTNDFVYSPLFSESTDVKETEYILKSSGNRDFFRGIYYIMNIRTFGMNRLSAAETEEISGKLSGKKLFEYSVDMKFTGMNKYSPYVCILTSDKTASSADYLVSAVASFDNTVIIGENTGGEKTGGQFMAELPESRLVYYYSASVILNSDGTDNSLYGTEPDIRCRLSQKSYEKYNQMISEGINPDKFENRLQWDDVLIKALSVLDGK